MFWCLSRYALPHARIMTAPPRMNRSFGSTTNMMIKANELEVNTGTYVEMLAKFTGAAAPPCRPFLECQG
jgi:ATP-dependent Clp protease, protease subunit